jgi:hypothetical protein
LRADWKVDEMVESTVVMLVVLMVDEMVEM